MISAEREPTGRRLMASSGRTRTTLASRVSRRALGEIEARLDEGRLAKHLETSIFSNHQRAYHYHVRKTGGTSINFEFLRLATQEPLELYGQLAARNSHRIESNGVVIVGWNRSLIRSGRFHYAFSHTPYEEISLPTSTYTFTILRDPVKRVVSHYRMLLELQQHQPHHPALRTESAWVGESFGDFLTNAPADTLLGQLSMFSSSLDSSKAAERVKGLSTFFTIDDFEAGVAKLGDDLSVPLSNIHVRDSRVALKPSSQEIRIAKNLLEPEYDMLSELGII